MESIQPNHFGPSALVTDGTPQYGGCSWTAIGPWATLEALGALHAVNLFLPAASCRKRLVTSAMQE